MLLNIKMPTNCWHFNIYKHDKFHAQLSLLSFAEACLPPLFEDKLTKVVIVCADM